MNNKTLLALNLILVAAIIALAFTLQQEKKERVELEVSIQEAIESFEAEIQEQIQKQDAKSKLISSRLEPVERRTDELSSKILLVSQITERNNKRIADISEPKALELTSLKARRIELVDREGNELIKLSSQKGRTSFVMRSGDQFNTIKMNIFEDGRKAVLFQNEAGINRMGFSTLADGTPRISLRGGGSYELEDMKAFTVAQFKEADSTPEMSFFDAQCNGDIFWTTTTKGHNQSGDDNSE